MPLQSCVQIRGWRRQKKIALAQFVETVLRTVLIDQLIRCQRFCQVVCFTADILEAILGHVGKREDAGCDNDRVDVMVGVDVGAIVGVSDHGQGVNLGVGLGVGLIVGPPPLNSLDS